MAQSAAHKHDSTRRPRATYQDVLDAPAHQVAEIIEGTLEVFELHGGQWLLIASAKDDDPVSIRPFDAITFSLGDLWP